MPIPLTLIVNDPPLINLYRWHAAESQDTDQPVLSTGGPVSQQVPVDFLEQSVEVVKSWRVCGKFSVLSYPAALGPKDDGQSGCYESGLTKWIDLVKYRVMPCMDITPEILTHARALDLETMTPQSINEEN